MVKNTELQPHGCYLQMPIVIGIPLHHPCVTPSPLV
jgi:hypothetical protein